jgi:tRNA (cmo5U34)-methyltransferase
MRWTFDAKVAAEFDTIAATQIPNYEKVIERCIDLAHAFFSHPPTAHHTAKIIDVGSARGRTITRLIDAGFTQTMGVEASADMIAVSAHPDKIILSNQFPLDKAPFDMVLANWTLHFISAREQYIRDIYNGLQKGGIFILSERMQGSPATYQCYLDFKRKSGVSEEAIKAKETALQGVLEPLPLHWYLQTLHTIGFTDIEVIDAAWCFNTILCRKAL